MGIREAINKHQGATTVVAAAIIVAVVGWTVLSQQEPGRAESAYYANEDGTGLFEADFDRIYPFEHDGQQAYRAYVYQCPDGKKFVSYLARYSEAVRKQMQELEADGSPEAMQQLEGLRGQGIEVKRPGDKKWLAQLSGEAQEIAAHPTCPDGTTASAIMP